MPLDVTEYKSIADERSGGKLPAAQEPAITHQQVAISGASAQSNAFHSATEFVRVHADEAVRVAFGANPTATATSMRMSAGATEYFGVRAGDKVAVISTT